MIRISPPHPQTAAARPSGPLLAVGHSGVHLRLLAAQHSGRPSAQVVRA